MQRVSGYVAEVFGCPPEVGAKLVAKEYDVRWYDRCLGPRGIFHCDACQRWCKETSNEHCKGVFASVTDCAPTTRATLIIVRTSRFRVSKHRSDVEWSQFWVVGVLQLFCDFWMGCPMAPPVCAAAPSHGSVRATLSNSLAPARRGSAFALQLAMLTGDSPDEIPLESHGRGARVSFRSIFPLLRPWSRRMRSNDAIVVYDAPTLSARARERRLASVASVRCDA